jgi:peroxiredoxin
MDGGEADMAIKIGDKLPDVSLRRLGDGGIEELGTDALTKGKKIVLFAVPGAFTPTCSEQHLPGFLQHADAIKAKGVDMIACVSVNDPFVMSEWSKATKSAGKIDILSDGNAEFTKAIGMELDASGFGLGIRSQRYAMVVEDGVVRMLLVEEVPTQAETSSANAILAAL